MAFLLPPLAVFSSAVGVLAMAGKVDFPRKSPVSTIQQQHIQAESPWLSVPSVVFTTTSLAVIRYFSILSFLGCFCLPFISLSALLSDVASTTGLRVSLTLATSQPQAPGEPLFPVQASVPAGHLHLIIPWDPQVQHIPWRTDDPPQASYAGLLPILLRAEIRSFLTFFIAGVPTSC